MVFGGLDGLLAVLEAPRHRRLEGDPDLLAVDLDRRAAAFDLVERVADPDVGSVLVGRALVGRRLLTPLEDGPREVGPTAVALYE